MMLAALSLTLLSTTFKPNARMPMSTVYAACGGSNRSPELHWNGVPKGTRSFALIAHDPDAPSPGGWYHWIVYNLPSIDRSIAVHARIAADQLGKTSFGKIGYGGPCPPPGKPHHYRFTLYALDEASISGEHLTGLQLKAAMAGHVLAQATLTGIFAKR